MAKNVYKYCCLFIFFAASSLLLSAQNIPTFKTGDKVVFIGNSITQGGTYHMLIQAFYATRFPNKQIEFYNAGIAGDVADGMIRRLDKDILGHQPNYAFVMVGMNDIRLPLYGTTEETDANVLQQRQAAIDNYKLKTEELINLLFVNNIKPILLTPSIYDQTAKIDSPNNFGANDALAICARHIRKMAGKYKLPLVDFHKTMSEINKLQQKENAAFTIVGHDRVHPGAVGHFVMAYFLLQKMALPNYVTSIVIDAKDSTVEQSISSQVKMETGHNHLKFKLLQKALPFPIKPRFSKALALVPFESRVNQESLTIRNLLNGQYALKIDGIPIAEVSAKEFSDGINLANNPKTPQYQQALEVFNLCEAYHKIQGKLRSVGLVEYRMLNTYNGPNSIEGKRAFLDAEVEKQKDKSWYVWIRKTCNNYFDYYPQSEMFKNQMKAIRSKIDEANKPVWHKYEIIKL